MARPIILSNGSLHVGLDEHGLVRDFYFPHIGQENHTKDKKLLHNIGIYVDGDFRWINDGSWVINPDYYGDVLVSRIVAINNKLQIRLEFDDCVDSEMNVFLRNIHVINLADTEREVRIFMHQTFKISDTGTNDTAQYDDANKSIVHYKGHRFFLVNGAHVDMKAFDTYTIGNTDNKDTSSFWDIEDGNLNRLKSAHGEVDSALGFHLTIRAHSSGRIHYWIAAGRSERDVKKLDAVIKEQGLLHHVLKTANWWSEWVKPTKVIADTLPERHRRSFIRSALIIKAACDSQGAVIASTDTSHQKLNKESYSYCWPREAAYSIWPLIRIGYEDEPLRYFSFVRRTLHEHGYLGHMYQADGALGPSWHQYNEMNGSFIPPIQSDATALTLFLFGQYYRKHPEPALLGSFYSTLVKPMANFLSGFTDDDGLPRPSYDIWEEKFLTTTYTTSVTYASLLEAAYLAEVFGDTESTKRWTATANKMFSKRHTFYNEALNYFYKGFNKIDNEYIFDETIDSSSLFGAYIFGYFDQSDPEVPRSYETLRDTLMTVGSKVIRYEGDAYRKNEADPHNPWPVATLWSAQYAYQTNDSSTVEMALHWIQSSMFATGVIAEQYDNDDSLSSVAPYTWSQAEYMNLLLDMITDAGETL